MTRERFFRNYTETLGMICEMPTSKELLDMHPLENCVTMTAESTLKGLYSSNVIVSKGLTMT